MLIVSANELNTNNELEEISAQKIYINSILSSHFSNIQGIYNLDFERTVLLLSYDNDDNEVVMNDVDYATKRVAEQLMSNMMA